MSNMNDTNDTNDMQNDETKIDDKRWQKLEPLLIGKPDDPGACLKQRKARGERKIVYTSMMNAAMNGGISKAAAKRTSKVIDESTSHWVGLVATQ